MKLVKAFDEDDCFKNVICALTLDIDEVLFVYHHRLSKKLQSAVNSIINKYKKIKINYININQKNEVKYLVQNSSNIMVDVSGVKYISLVLFDHALKHNKEIVYYDDEEHKIKTYKEHKVISENVFKLSIDDVVILGGGKVVDHMHKTPRSNDRKSNQLIIKTVESSLDRYPAFISFVSRTNNLIVNRETRDGLNYPLKDEEAKRLYSDETFRYYKKIGLLKLESNKLSFPTKQIKEMFMVSGSFLESYLYIKLKESNLFDDVMMSVIIDFSGENKHYPLRCEIDALVMKDNHLLFVSCKSNKVKTEDLNEIKVHNTIFGNVESYAAICTMDDLNVTNPSIYSKAKELGIAIIDISSFKNNAVAGGFLKIIEGKYNYENIPRYRQNKTVY